jgi:serine/threonine-protein kinase
VFVSNCASNEVLKLSAGGSQTTLPFTGLNAPYGVAVDAAGDVFVTNRGSNEVLKLTSGGTQTTLPFAGLNAPEGVGVDPAGNVYVANNGSNEVLQLTAGGTQTTLGFVLLDGPAGLAVDAIGSVFVANYNSTRSKSCPGSSTSSTRHRRRSVREAAMTLRTRARWRPPLIALRSSSATSRGARRTRSISSRPVRRAIRAPTTAASGR